MENPAGDRGSDALLVAGMFLALFLIVSAVLLYSAGGQPAAQGTAAWAQASANARRFESALAGHSIALLSGHHGYDSGAVCPDGLREVDVNWQIARRVNQALQEHGASVQLLQEHDQRLDQIQADLFLSLHSDSCIERSGFKAARWHGSYDQAKREEDLFLACLQEQYSAATGLSWSANTISRDMKRYYAFRYINAKIPAVILEMGFLGGDRSLLLHQQSRVVQGIIQSIGCFFARKG